MWILPSVGESAKICTKLENEILFIATTSKYIETIFPFMTIHNTDYKQQGRSVTLPKVIPP